MPDVLERTALFGTRFTAGGIEAGFNPNSEAMGSDAFRSRLPKHALTFLLKKDSEVLSWMARLEPESANTLTPSQELAMDIAQLSHAEQHDGFVLVPGRGRGHSGLVSSSNDGVMDADVDWDAILTYMYSSDDSVVTCGFSSDEEMSDRRKFIFNARIATTTDLHGYDRRRAAGDRIPRKQSPIRREARDSPSQ